MRKVQQVVKIMKLQWQRGDVQKFFGTICATEVIVIVWLLMCGGAMRLFSGNPYDALTFKLEVGRLQVILRLSAIAVRVFWLVGMLVLIIATDLAWQLLQDAQQKWLCESVLDDPIAANHGETIEEVISNIRYEPVEYLAIFDQNGKKLGETTNLNPESVTPDAALWKYVRDHPGCIKVHNHPNVNGAFSANDFSAAIRAGASKTIVIAAGMVYTLELPSDLNDSDAEEVKEYYQDHCQPMELKTLSTPSKELQTDLAAVAAIMLCRDIAGMYGMEFTAEPYAKSRYAEAVRTKVVRQTTPTTKMSLCARLTSLIRPR